MGELTQLGDDEADVVAGGAEDRVEGVAEAALERVSAQATVHLHVPDGRLNGASAPDHGSDSSPATSRGDSAGRPRLEAKWVPKLRSTSSQSISAASRTSECARSVCSSSLGRNSSLSEGILGFGPILKPIANCRKPNSGTTLPRKPNSQQAGKTSSAARTYELFKTD